MSHTKDRKFRSMVVLVTCGVLFFLVVLYIVIGYSMHHFRRDADPVQPVPPIAGEIIEETDGFAPDANKISDMETGDDGISTGPTAFATTLRKVAPTVTTNHVETMIAYGMNFLGRPYVYGSKRYEPSTFDCSDFVHHTLLGGLGMDIRAYDSRKQWEYVDNFGVRKYTDIGQARRGDILFFMSYRGYKAADYAGIDKAAQRITHVGIYLGNGQILHTASAPTGVRIQSISGHLTYRFLKGGSLF